MNDYGTPFIQYYTPAKLPSPDTFVMDRRDLDRVKRTADKINIPGIWWIDVLIGAFASAGLSTLVACIYQDNYRCITAVLAIVFLAFAFFSILFRLLFKKISSFNLNLLKDLITEVNDTYSSRAALQQGSDVDA